MRSKTPITIFAISLVIFSCLLHIVAGARLVEVFNRVFESFNESSYDIFENLGNASISFGALQITPDSGSGDFKMSNRSGRLMLKQPFRLWDDTNKTRVASFRSSFLMNVFRPNNATAGEGLAFLIASNLEIPLNSYGEYLGLTNQTIDNNPNNKFIAVEFDTVRQVVDLDANHVGLDLNSVRSTHWESLTPHGIELAPIGATFHNVWVKYDGADKLLEIYIAEQANKSGDKVCQRNIADYNRCLGFN